MNLAQLIALIVPFAYLAVGVVLYQHAHHAKPAVALDPETLNARVQSAIHGNEGRRGFVIVIGPAHFIASV